MKIIFKILLTAMLAIPCIFVNAQSTMPLKIGDKVPDLFLAKMLNHKAQNGKLGDFKGKAIIIDQWFISCAPCVSAMPHLYQLQMEFNTDLQILPVTFEKKNDVEKFWAENIVVKGSKFAQVIEDTLVRRYFPAISFPQQVWIDKNGIIQAITDGKAANKSNVQKLINGEKLSLDEKHDETDKNVRMASEPDMLIRYKDTEDKLQYYSYISKYRKEFAGTFRSVIDTAKKLVRITGNNAPMEILYDRAYSNNSWESTHLQSRFIIKRSKSVEKHNELLPDTAKMFCYDLMYRDSTINHFKEYMIPDLDRFFRFRSHEEVMDVPCYVISPNGKGIKYKEIYQPERERYYTVSPLAKKIIVNNHFPWMLENVINNYTDKPVLFELNGAKRVNFEVDWSFNNLEKMNEDFKKFDLKIEKVNRKRKVIILEQL